MSISLSGAASSLATDPKRPILVTPYFYLNAGMIRQKSPQITEIKRQANKGLKGILREGRGRGPSPSLIKNSGYF